MGVESAMPQAPSGGPGVRHRPTLVAVVVVVLCFVCTVGFRTAAAEDTISNTIEVQGCSQSEEGVCQQDQDNNMFHHYQTPQTVGNKILTLTEEQTSNKRIYVIGDVHGCYDELTLLLRQARVLRSERLEDGLVDDALIVFVGDLVNKGPKSNEVLQFAMTTKGVYTVLGNHEVYWLERGAGRHRDEDYYDYLRSLPYVISIPQYNALVVHAGFLPNLPLEEQPTRDIVVMRNVVSRGGGEIAAYEDTDAGVHWGGLWTGPQHVYFGHDARRGQDEQGNPRVQRMPLVTGLDTRCVKGGALTAVRLPVESEEFHSVKAKKVYSLM